MRQIEFQVIDPDTAERWPLPDYSSCSISGVRGSAGMVEFDYPTTGRNFDRISAHVTRDRDVYVVVRVDGRETPDLTAIVSETKGDTTDPGAVWTFSGRFLAALLDEAIVGPDTIGLPNLDPEREFSTATGGEIIRTLVLEAQERGALAGVDVGSFSDLTDSTGTAWAKITNIEFAPGQSVRKVLDKLSELDLCDWEMRGMSLHLFNPGALGRDLTVGANPLIFHGPRSLTDAPRTHSVRNSPTSVYVAGKEGLYITADDASAEARRGRRIESYVSSGNISDPGTLAAFAQATLNRTTPGTLQVTHGLAFGAGGPEPLTDFVEGDWAFSDTGQGLERLQIAQWSVSVDDSGITGTVTLNDLIASRDAKLSRRLDELAEGGVVVGASTAPPAPPTETAKAPATPTNLVASSLVYTEPGPPPTITSASVSASWLAVTTHADGTPVASTPSYRVRYRYLTGDAALNATQPYPPKWVVTDDGYVWLPAGETAAAPLLFSGLSADQQIELQVAAVIQLDPEQQPYEFDEFNRAFRRTEMQSTWSPGFQLITANDLTAPPAPAAPVVSNGVGDMLRVTWNGLDNAGADMLLAAPDFERVEVHMSTTSNFTPDATTYRDVLFAAGAIVITDQLLYGVTYYARLVAIDLAGNRSATSAQHSGTPALIADGDLASISISKLTAGVLTADLTLSARIKTANTGARIEMDAASFRQFDSAGTLRTRFTAADGSALVTGQLQSALSGERWVMMPDGTLRLYPSVGTNYSAIFNVGGSLILGGQLDAQGRSGYLNVLATGIAAQFGIPGQTVTAQLSVGSGNVDLTSPINGLRVDKRFAHPTGGLRCNVLLFNDSDGDDIAGTVLQHREWNSSAFALAAPGRNANILFANDNSRAIKLVYNDGNFADLQCGNVYAPNVVAPSGADVKQNIGDIPFSVLDVVRGAESKRWQYRPELMPSSRPDVRGAGKVRRRKPGTDPVTGKAKDFEEVELATPPAPLPATPDRVGPMADDIRAIEPSLVQVGEEGELALSYGDLIGVLWKAVAELADKVDTLTDKYPDIPELPGRSGKAKP